MSKPRKLLIISASSKMTRQTESPIPAIERYDGLLVRVVKKALKEKDHGDIEVLLLSPVLGLVEAKDEIPYHEPLPGCWKKPNLTEKEINSIREKNTAKLQFLLKSRQYAEIYINVGKVLRQLLDLRLFSGSKIIFAEGPGPGPKAAHMKSWIQRKVTPTKGRNTP